MAYLVLHTWRNFFRLVYYYDLDRCKSKRRHHWTGLKKFLSHSFWLFLVALKEYSLRSNSPRYLFMTNTFHCVTDFFAFRFGIVPLFNCYHFSVSKMIFAHDYSLYFTKKQWIYSFTRDKIYRREVIKFLE